jgi:WD40 repeat protein
VIALADVFISYSRRDLAFARLLHQGLLDNGFDAWIDWQDIAPSTEWLAEVYSAIESADTFVFIISQTSVASETCSLEIAHAIDNNKRLIPVVIDEVTPERVTPELAALNWLFFHAGDEFSETYQQLVDAIQTDHAWVKEHTRLQVRALEWTRKPQPRASLLRGSDLKEAEDWLTQAPTKQPKPTDLQATYILASRRAERRRWRLVAGGILGSLLLVLAASLTALVIQTNARNQAETALQVAQSRQLAASSSQNLQGDLGLALLLSLEAVGVKDTVEARSSLLAALNRSARIDTLLHGQDSEILSLAFSPDGDLLASGDCLEEEYLGGGTAECVRGAVLIWDLETRQLVETLTTGLQNTITMSFSPDGTLLAIGGSVERDGLFLKSSQGAVELWDMTTRRQVAVLTGPGKGDSGMETQDSQIDELAFSPDGRWLAGAGTATQGDHGGTIMLWRVEDHEAAEELTFDWQITGLAFDPDGAWLAVSSRSGDAVGVWPISERGPEPIGMRWDVESPRGIAFHPAGEALAVSRGDGSIVVIDPLSGEMYGQPLTGSAETGGRIQFSADGHYLVSGGAGNRIDVWEVALPEDDYRSNVAFELHAPTSEVVAVTQTAFGPDSYRLASGSQDGSITLWDLAKVHPLMTSEYPTRGSDGLAFNAVGSVVAATGDRVRLWSLPGGDELPPLPVHRWDWHETAVAFSPDGRTLIVGDGNFSENVTIWDLELDQPIAIGLEGHEASVTDVAFSPTGDLAASSSSDGSIILWDPVNGTALGGPLLDESDSTDLAIQGGDGLHAVYGIAFTPDGDWLVSGRRGGDVLIWDVAGQQPQRPAWRAHRDAVTAVAVSPDGRAIASGGNDGMIRIWDAETNALLGELAGHSDYVSDVAFSADGALLASRESWNGGMRLWDVPTMRPLGEALPEMADDVYSLTFSPRGRILASGGSAVTIWDLSATIWLEQARKIANRDLAPAESSLYGISE